MDFSRLNVTAFDNNKNKIEKIVIVFVGFKPTYFLFVIFLAHTVNFIETVQKKYQLI